MCVAELLISDVRIGCKAVHGDDNAGVSVLMDTTAAKSPNSSSSATVDACRGLGDAFSGDRVRPFRGLSRRRDCHPQEILLEQRGVFPDGQRLFLDGAAGPCISHAGVRRLCLLRSSCLAGRDCFRRERRRGCSRRWLIWMPSLEVCRFTGSCSLLMAAGFGRVITQAIAAHDFAALRASSGLILRALLVRWLCWRPCRRAGRRFVNTGPSPDHLCASLPILRNVVLVVWDTVRAYDMSLHGFGRLCHTEPAISGHARG